MHRYGLPSLTKSSIIKRGSCFKDGKKQVSCVVFPPVFLKGHLFINLSIFLLLQHLGVFYKTSVETEPKIASRPACPLACITDSTCEKW